MTSALGHDPNPLADLPSNGKGANVAKSDNIVSSSGADALRAAMSNPAAVLRGEDVTVSASQDTFGRLKGVQNPYGSGIYAYEPNTTLLDDYSKSYNAVQSSKSADQAAADTLAANTVTADGKNNATSTGYAGGGIIQADSRVSTMVQAALNLAAKRVPYVWGGTSASGVDCSGLVFYAAQAAGIQGVKRWRAQDYGQLGTQVSSQDARPGDLVYYDEPGDTDHVGIYLGQGKMVAAPTTGDVVKVQAVYGTPQFRRVFNDSSYAATPQPYGGITYSYDGGYYNPAGQTTDSNTIIRSGTAGTRTIAR